MTYTIIWEYLVKADALTDFERAYRPGGLWAQLFARADGYLGTELHRDLEDERRFVTVDYWSSRQAHERFLEHYGAPYAALDRACAAFTDQEIQVGNFSCFGTGRNFRDERSTAL